MKQILASLNLSLRWITLFKIYKMMKIPIPKLLMIKRNLLLSLLLYKENWMTQPELSSNMWVQFAKKHNEHLMNQPDRLSNKWITQPNLLSNMRGHSGNKATQDS